MKPDIVMEMAKLPLHPSSTLLGIHKNPGLHLNQQEFCHSLQWSQNFTLQFEILSADDRQVKWLPHCSHCLCVINCAKIIIAEVQYRCSLPHSFSAIFHPPLSSLFPYSSVFYSSLLFSGIEYQEERPLHGQFINLWHWSRLPLSLTRVR